MRGMKLGPWGQKLVFGLILSLAVVRVFGSLGSSNGLPGPHIAAHATPLHLTPKP